MPVERLIAEWRQLGVAVSPRVKYQVAWAQEWIERIGGLYQLNARRLELGQDQKEPQLPAPFVRMDPERMAGVDYQKADQSLRQAVAVFQGQWAAELTQEKLPLRRRKTLESLREHWGGLTLFVEHPEIPLDNNESERAIRSATIGRKNFYGSGSACLPAGRSGAERCWR